MRMFAAILSELTAVLLVGAMIFGIGWAVRAVVGRGSPERLARGRVILTYTVSGWIVGGFLGAAAKRAESLKHETELIGTLAAFGLLLGWIIGLVHSLLFMPQPAADVLCPRCGAKSAAGGMCSTCGVKSELHRGVER